jgi:hypothetical protein
MPPQGGQTTSQSALVVGEGTLEWTEAEAKKVISEVTVKTSTVPERTIKVTDSKLGHLEALHGVKKTAAKLILTLDDLPEAQRVIRIEGLETDLGRGDECSITISHPSVSSKHATITFFDGRFSVADHGSTNHTFVNGHQIQPGSAVPIDSNTAVTFGAVPCLFVCDGPPAGSPNGNSENPKLPDNATIVRHLIHRQVLSKAQGKAVLTGVADSGCSIGQQIVLKGFMTPTSWSEVIREIDCEPVTDTQRKLWVLVAVLATILSLVVGGVWYAIN